MILLPGRVLTAPRLAGRITRPRCFQKTGLPGSHQLGGRESCLVAECSVLYQLTWLKSELKHRYSSNNPSIRDEYE